MSPRLPDVKSRGRKQEAGAIVSADDFGCRTVHEHNLVQ